MEDKLKRSAGDFRSEHRALIYKKAGVERSISALEARITNRFRQLCLNFPEVPLSNVIVYGVEKPKGIHHSFNNDTCGFFNKFATGIGVVPIKQQLNIIHCIEKYVINTNYGKQTSLEL